MMIAQCFSRMGLAVAFAAAGSWLGAGSAFAAPPEPIEASADLQVLTRGPVHEAFAETVTFDPEPGIIVATAPPEAIEELPPDQKPAGDNVAWISGYWAWDDESSEYLWVSGTWRALPPGRQWVSGYWADTQQGVQWTSGYWANAELTEAEYLPEPPESVEAGPNVEAPSADHVWLPGCWTWNQNQYAWRPGYWAPAQANWVWIPAHHVWTPRGYVGVEGYWDHTVDRRGVLFAPVSFRQSVYSQRGFSYTPRVVIDLGVFSNHLFLRPNYGHYYFGDYYGSNYASNGFTPWFSFQSNRFGYDPFFVHQRWNHRDDRQWNRRIEADYARRRDNEGARPPRTLAAQMELGRGEVTDENRDRVFARTLDQVAKSKENSIRFQPVSEADRKALTQVRTEARTNRAERRKLEAEAAADVKPDAPRTAREIRPGRAKLPRSPYVAKEVDDAGDAPQLPKAQILPQTDPKIVPKVRKPRVVNPAVPTKVDPRATPADDPKVNPKVSPKANPKIDVPVDPKANPRGNPNRTPSTEEQKPTAPRVEERPRQPEVEPKQDDSKPGQPLRRRAIDPKPGVPIVE